MDDAYKGQRAQIILDDEVFQEAIASARQRIYRVWQAEPGAGARERLWLEQKALDAVRAELREMVNRGVQARRKKEREQVNA